ncbi:MAG: phosphate acetyltransferase [Propionibacteriaceae bacterium]|nr:phosphate acetyltransferase [Propionibacteriaceae bacterium]
MTNTVYIVASEARVGKSAVGLGAIESLRQLGHQVGVFRPIIRTEGHDTTLATLLEAAATDQQYDQGYGVTYAQIREDTDAAITTIIARFEEVKKSFDTIVVLGSDYSDVIGPVEFSLNAQIAANLNAPVILVVSGRGQTPVDLRHAIDFCLEEIARQSAFSLGVVAIGLDADRMDDYDRELVTVDLPIVVTFPGAVSLVAQMPATFATTIARARSNVRTPLVFQYELAERARSDRRTVVLPESLEPRILTAAHILLERDLVNLILLGDADEIHAKADSLHVDVSKAKIQPMDDPEMIEEFAAEYVKLRAHKGMTMDKARETLTDVSYFGTMMIHLGMADGMVSGSIHTTAHTIRPSLEFIKTKPGMDIVSGYFLMCLPDRVLVFADCAVNPNPTVDQLAGIGLASAHTAVSFGIEPKVAMLSYSTGTSGTGPDVDMVHEATQILHDRDPELPVEGPIQFDAAVDEVVAKTKLPESRVAGHATVFIFPDLNTGNTTYKAVQRTANALAIGPVLQGLRKPVNDLSRGALVDDIVNTIIITAIQAQSDPAAPF